METSDAHYKRNSNLESLDFHILTCKLCDVVFLREFKEDYHTIISGYDNKKGIYTQTGQYQTNHILTYAKTITLTKEDLLQELDELSSKIREKVEEIMPLSKVDQDLEFNARKILINFYAKQGGSL